MDDRELSLCLRKAGAGSLADVDALVRHFTPVLVIQAEHRITRALRRIVDPADVVNDVWLVALRRLPTFAPVPGAGARSFLGYLGTILLHHVRDLYEKHLLDKPATAEAPAGASDSEAPGAVQALAEDATGVVTRAVREERWAALREAIGALDPTDRAVVVLRGIEGLSNEAVSQLTGLQPNTVSARLRRAIDKLRCTLPAALADELERI